MSASVIFNNSQYLRTAFFNVPELKFMARSMLPDTCYIGHIMVIEVSRIIHILNEVILNFATVMYIFTSKIG